MPLYNLLYVITKLELGGAQTQLLSIAGGIDKRVFRTKVSASRGILSRALASLDGVTAERTNFLVRQIHPLKDICALAELALLMRRLRIQVVHTHSSKAGIIGRLAARLAGVPVVIHTVHGWSFNDYQPCPVKKFYILLERFCAGFTDAIITVSAHDKAKGIACGIGTPGKYELIRYGIDFGLYPARDKDYLSRVFGLRQSDKVVCMVGCFKPQKAPLDFIKVAALTLDKFPGTRFVLIGDGEMRPAIERAVQRTGLQGKVILAGWRDDLPGLLAGADIFALTSLWEGLPISALEALKSGVPVVATDTGGIKEVVADGVNGYIVPRGDTVAMSRRICELLRDDDLRLRLGGNAALSLGSEYSLGKMLLNIQSLYAVKLREKAVYAPDL